MRKIMDCRDSPSVSGCTLTISGEENEVIRAAMEHAESVHGEKPSAELREQLRGALKDEAGESSETKTSWTPRDNLRKIS